MADVYDTAVRQWVAQKIGVADWESISGVEFDMGSDGYCETCYSEFITISYQYGKKSGDVGSIRYDTPTQLIREVAEIAKGLEA